MTCWLYSCWNSPVSLFAARVHCWLMVNLFYMRTFRLFSIKKKKVSGQSVLILCWNTGLFWLRKDIALFSAAELNEVCVGIFLYFVEVCMNGSLAPNPPSSPLHLVSPTKLQLLHSIPLSRWLMKIPSLKEKGRMIPETHEIAGKCDLYFLLNFIYKMVSTKFQSYRKKTLMLTSLYWEDS